MVLVCIVCRGLRILRSRYRDEGDGEVNGGKHWFCFASDQLDTSIEGNMDNPLPTFDRSAE